MSGWLYLLSLATLVPGGLLALYFGAVQRTATSRGWGGFFGALFEMFRWLQGWRLLALVAGLLFLVGAALVTRLRPWGAGAVCLVALAAAVTLVRVGRRAGPPAGEGRVLMFWLLSPLAAGALSGWVLWRDLR